MGETQKLKANIMQKISKMSNVDLTKLKKLLTQLEADSPKEKSHSITELKGLGAEIWKGINVQKYLNEERNSWVN